MPSSPSSARRPGRGASKRRRQTDEVVVPLAAKIVGRTAAVLAFVGIAAFLAIIVVLAVAGAGNGNDVSATPLGELTLNVLVPILAVSLILSLLLALLNSIGVKPWFDVRSGRFVRPVSMSEWAIKLGGLLAGILIPLTLITVVVLGAVLFSADDETDTDVGSLLFSVLLAGIGSALTLAGVAGGIAVMGWYGVVAGFMFGTGFTGIVIGSQGGGPVAWILGGIALAVSVATYYGGARRHGTIPRSVGSFAASGGYLALGVGFIVLAITTHQPTAFVGGVAGIAATAGWVIGGLRSPRHIRQQ